MERIRTPRKSAARSKSTVLAAQAGDQPRYPITSVDNALRLVLMFRDQRWIRVAEASESLGVVRSTAHRLLAMLQYRGLVQQDPETKAYAAGPALVDIGLSVVRDMDVRRHLRPYLEQLALDLGETVQLMILDGADTLFIDSVESHQALRTSSRIGRRYPAHNTSGGKVLLAQLPTERLGELYPTERLPTLTSRSTKRRAELFRELDRVREQGYGTNRGESEPDVAAVAVGVTNAFGQIRAAIAMSAPLSRFDEASVPRVAAILREAAGRAAQHLT
ncbi:MAG: IclR family transcriptional regulator [Pseudonocardiales bacterium]|nr:MAG: IclR family transcriptional regulator [Pseudonocardiales bacterium]